MSLKLSVAKWLEELETLNSSITVKLNSLTGGGVTIWIIGILPNKRQFSYNHSITGPTLAGLSDADQKLFLQDTLQFILNEVIELHEETTTRN